MPTVVQFRRGTTAQNNNFLGANGEISVDTTLNVLRVADAVTLGGFAMVGQNCVQTIANKTYTGTLLSVTGNVTGNYIFGNGSQLSGIDATSIQSGTSNVKVTTAGGNVAVSVGGTSNVVVWASTGTYTTGISSVTGNITGGNLLTSGLVSATGNITGGNILGGANVNATTHTGTTVSVTGNITGGNVIASTGLTAGTLSLSGNTITSTDNTITIDPASSGPTGHVIIQGNLSVTGNVTYINSNNVTTNDLTINMANNAATAAAANGGGIEVGPAGTPYATITYNSTSNTWAVSNGANVSGAVSVSGNITGGNISTGGVMVITGASTAASYSATGNVTGGNLSAGTGTITGGNIVNSNANGVGNIGSATTYFNTVFAKATSAQYADLAEMYVADTAYAAGTVVEFGGNNEITVATTTHSTQVAGIISTQPAYLMNSAQAGEHPLEVALVGRVPCSVVGTVRKGDRLVSSDLPGVAQALDINLYQPGCIVGKALEEYNSTEPGVIEVAVGRS